MLDTIESESTTRFKNRSSDRMMTSDWLIDVSDDRYTTNWHKLLLIYFTVLWAFYLFKLLKSLENISNLIATSSYQYKKDNCKHEG